MGRGLKPAGAEHIFLEYYSQFISGDSVLFHRGFRRHLLQKRIGNDHICRYLTELLFTEGRSLHKML